MASDRRAQKMVIAGASSLLGNELKSVLEESRFAGWNLQLVDEEIAAGTLTAARGEATVIQAVDEDTFQGARYVFLTGSTAFSKECLKPAKAAGAKIIDFSRASLSDPDAAAWFPRIEALSGKTLTNSAKLFLVCSAAATAVASLAMTLGRVGSQRLVVVLFEPVSEAGREGIEELETQTSQLLSFQNIGTPVFGTQAAFNLLPCYGTESRQDLHQKLVQIRGEIGAVVQDAEADEKIAVNLVHVPVFYGMTFTAYAEMNQQVDEARLLSACQDAGFTLVPTMEAAPSNVSVAGETGLFLRTPERDSARAAGWWFWGAADNLRLPAWSGCKLAERLEE